MVTTDATSPSNVSQSLLATLTLFAVLLVFGSKVSTADILSVPTTYATVGAAVAAANDGDTIEIAAGIYTGSGIVVTLSVDNLTIRGIGGQAHLNAEGVVISNRKAIFVTTGDNITLENIEFSNAVVPDENGAGIRHEGGLLTVRNCYFHDNENGILTSGQDHGELFIENSGFDANGLGRAGYTHNIYVGHIRKFTMQYSCSHHATHGHNVKTRAAENHIRYNRIMDEDTGNASYQIDIPNGGLTYVIGNTIHQGMNAENSTMISYAAEGLHPDNPVQEIYISGNTMVNDRSNGRAIRLSYNPTAVVVNNIFDNFGVDSIVDGNPIVYENNVTGSENYFSDRSNYDFHLTGTSPALAAAGIPGTYNGSDLTPLYEYVHPQSSRPRIDDGHLDVGAFEYSNTPSVDPPITDPPTADPDVGSSGGGCFVSILYADVTVTPGN